MVATGASAQRVCTAQNLKKMEPSTTNLKMQKFAEASSMTPMITKKAQTHRASGIAGTYIMEAWNFAGDFAENTSFSIEEGEGTILAGGFDDNDELVFDREFNYNVKLTNFSTTGDVVYGDYIAEENVIHIPMQKVYTADTYGDVVMSGSKRSDTGGINYGSDIVLTIEDNGSIYFDEEYSTGWFSFLPYYEEEPFATWNYGLDASAYYPNATLGSVETHIVNGAWGEWGNKTYDVYVEDFETEMTVHNFFGLCPISIIIDGDKAGIECPVKVIDYDYAKEGEEPNYIQIWQWDENFENIINPGEITGNVFVDEDGTKIIEFYETEYREAWTDENGDHEAGNYILTDYTKWFMVHSNWGENGAYWWGEARNVYIVIPPTDVEGITDVKASEQSTKAYNLMGQQVKNAKGIIIRDGKKLMMK